MSRDLIWRLVREWKLQSLGVLKIFHGSLHDFLAGGPSSREKHLNKFFQFFSQGFWRIFRDSFQSRKSFVLRFKNSLLKKKKNQFSLVHFDYSLSCPFISLSQTHRVSHKNPPIFFIISTSNFKKRYGFSIFLKAFHVYNL